MTQETPKLVDIEQICDGWIKKYIVHYELSDGTPYQYDCASRKALAEFRHGLENNGRGVPPAPDAVCIVPQMADGTLLLIREFRYPLNSWCIAFPAGLVEPNENLAEAVDRELREETGFALRRDLGDGSLEAAVRPLPQAGFSSTGLTDETVQIVFAQVERVADATPELGELIRPFTIDRRAIRAFLDSNTTPIGTRAQLILELLA